MNGLATFWANIGTFQKFHDTTPQGSTHDGETDKTLTKIFGYSML